MTREDGRGRPALRESEGAGRGRRRRGPLAGLAATAIREWQRIARSPYLLLLIAVFPIASGALMAGVFGSGAVRDVPVVAVDLDGSALSRDFLRMVDASAGVRVAAAAPDMRAAEQQVMRGEAYGIVLVPQHFARDAARGEAPAVTAFYNAQFLVPTSQIKTAVSAAAATLSARVEFGRRAAQEPAPAAAAHVEPIVLDAHALFNEPLNYVTYLVTPLLPTLLQIFIVIAIVHAYGSEARDGTAGEWFASSGGRPWAAVAGKAVPYVLHFTALAFLMLGVIYGPLGVPFRGSFGVVAWATVAFVAAYVAMGFAFIAVAGDLRIGGSIAAFYCTPAFAFAGVTFPVEGMPLAGQAWGSLLPVTHYLRILVQQAMRAAPEEASWQAFLAIAAFAVLPWPVVVWRTTRLARRAAGEAGR